MKPSYSGRNRSHNPARRLLPRRLSTLRRNGSSLAESCQPSTPLQPAVATCSASATGFKSSPRRNSCQAPCCGTRLPAVPVARLPPSRGTIRDRLHLPLPEGPGVSRSHGAWRWQLQRRPGDARHAGRAMTGSPSAMSPPPGETTDQEANPNGSARFYRWHLQCQWPRARPYAAPRGFGGSADGRYGRSAAVCRVGGGTRGMTVDESLAKQFGLSSEEYGRVLAIMGRTPSLTELGIFSVMWSEHCSYKSSRVWLKQLPTKAPWVIHGPGENAGVVDIGEGLAAIFKMESHNHPSFIEPYQGAATGVGRHSARCLHHGCAPDRQPQRAAFRQPGPSLRPSVWSTAWCAASAATAIAWACRPSAAKSISIPPTTETRWSMR